MKFMVVVFFKGLMTCPVTLTGLVAVLYFIRFKLHYVCWCISLYRWYCVLKSLVPIISYSLFKTFQLLFNSDWQLKQVENLRDVLR